MTLNPRLQYLRKDLRGASNAWKRTHALPEAIVPDEWLILDREPYLINRRQKLISAPTGADGLPLAIRVHDYLHIKHSPESFHGARPRDGFDEFIIRMFEATRVHLIGKNRYGLGKELRPLFTRSRLTEDMKFDPYGAGEDFESIMMYIYAHEFATKELPLPLEPGLFHGTFGLVARKYREAIEANLDSFDVVVALAKELADLYRSKCTNIRSSYSDRKEGVGYGDLPSCRYSNPFFDAEAGDPDKLSGRMNIDRSLPMTRKPVVDIGRFLRKLDMGFAFKHPERLLTDGRCFVEPRRAQLATILMDCSGSMGRDRNMILKLAQRTGGATIAGYSGDCGHGTLWILADKGKIVEQMPAFPNGNIVDYHALKWLSTQPKPRIWISDGGVTGIGDNSHGAITRACLEIVSKSNIMHFKHIHAFDPEISGGEDE